MKLHHLGWAGRDLDRMRRLFEKEGATSLGAPVRDPAQRVVVQLLRSPGSGDLWELIVPEGAVEDSPLTSRLARGGGLDHVCYELEEGDGGIEACLEAEVARGARVVQPPVMATAFGRRIAFVFRRSGRLVELLEAPAPAGRA